MEKLNADFSAIIPIIETSPTLPSFLFAPLPGHIPRLAIFIKPISPESPTAASMAIIGQFG